MEAWQKKDGEDRKSEERKEDRDRTGQAVSEAAKKENQEGRGANRDVGDGRPLSLLQPVSITVHGSQGCAERNF